MIKLRKAKESDLMFYFDLRNEPSVRAQSFSTEPVDLAAHTAWFLEKLEDPDSWLLIVQVQNESIGQVRVDMEQNQGEISIAIAPEHRGKGYAALAIREACDLVFREDSQVDMLLAHTKKDNEASQKSFARAGFLKKGDVSYKGEECIEMMLRKTDL